MGTVPLRLNLCVDKTNTWKRIAPRENIYSANL